jgi:hypothetical protein
VKTNILSKAAAAAKPKPAQDSNNQGKPAAQQTGKQTSKGNQPSATAQQQHASPKPNKNTNTPKTAGKNSNQQPKTQHKSTPNSSKTKQVKGKGQKKKGGKKDANPYAALGWTEQEEDVVTGINILNLISPTHSPKHAHNRFEDPTPCSGYTDGAQCEEKGSTECKTCGCDLCPTHLDAICEHGTHEINPRAQHEQLEPPQGKCATPNCATIARFQCSERDCMRTFCSQHTYHSRGHSKEHDGYPLVIERDKPPDCYVRKRNLGNDDECVFCFEVGEYKCGSSVCSATLCDSHVETMCSEHGPTKTAELLRTKRASDSENSEFKEIADIATQHAAEHAQTQQNTPTPQLLTLTPSLTTGQNLLNSDIDMDTRKRSRGEEESTGDTHKRPNGPRK